MQHHPVVVPGCELPRLVVVVRVGRPVAPRVVDLAVVKFDERALQPGDHHVLVVPRIADNRGAVAHPRQIFEPARLIWVNTPGLDPQLRGIGRVV